MSKEFKAVTKPEIKVLDWKRASLNNESDKRLVELTEAELQFLIKRIEKDIFYAQDEMSYLKPICAKLYKTSDKSITSQNFAELNHRRDALRYWKSINKKLSAIQAKLKRAR